MYHIHCLNKISPKGTALLTDNYAITDDRNQADGVLVRSADMHNVALPESLLAVARAGAGVNNIPLSDCAEAGVVVFNTPGANANSVMELALCGMLLSSRDVVGGINWVQTIKDDPISPNWWRRASPNSPVMKFATRIWASSALAQWAALWPTPQGT